MCHLLASVWHVAALLLASPGSLVPPHGDEAHAGLPIHAPHDNVHDLACARLASGSVAIVAASSEEQKWIVSTDRGLSWRTLSGAGIERAKPLRVDYWPDAHEPRFVLGTDRGIWFYDPETGALEAVSAGLPLTSHAYADEVVTEISAARNGKGPVAAAVGKGSVLLWSPQDRSWQPVLESGERDLLGTVAVAPDFDPGAPAGPDRTILAAFGGVLHRSVDGGTTWTVHPQFSTLAQGTTDWHVRAIAFDTGFSTSGVVLLARGKEDLGSPYGTSGEVWRSDDFGATFALAHTPGSEVLALEATPASAGGPTHFFHAVESYPKRSRLSTSLGLFRSVDGGVTWSDHGSAQDFILEPRDLTVHESWRRIMGFGVSPDYATDGTILFGRAEGLFRSFDEGVHWRPIRVRSATFVRSIGIARDLSGGLLAFGATYGAGTLMLDLTTGQGRSLAEVKSSFQDAVAVSPHFELDGMVAVGGDEGFQAWFDPSRPPNNPHGATGWVFDIVDRFGYTRSVAMAPQFDASGTVGGSNQVLFWSTRNGPGSPMEPRRSFGTEDAGVTWREFTKSSNGASVPFLKPLVVAPTFDPLVAGRRTDVYAASGNWLLVLVEDTWVALHEFESPVADLAIDPDWARPGTPRLFVALREAPHIAIVAHEPGRPLRIERIDAPGLEQQVVQRLAVPPDYAARPVLYLTTWGSGVRKLDRRAAAPRWEPVAANDPATMTEALALSPDFAQDRMLVVGTMDGYFVGQDRPGGTWTQQIVPVTISTKDSALAYYDPGSPSNPAPDRVWPWPRVGLHGLQNHFPGLRTIGAKVAFTTSDGAYVEWEGPASELALHAIEGPGHGTVLFEIFDFDSGVLLASSRTSLSAAATAIREFGLAVPGTSVGSPRDVRLRFTAELAAGESFVFDGLTVTR